MTDEAVSLLDDVPADEYAELISKHAVSDVVLYSLDWSVDTLLARVGSSLDINPAFQRRDAWTIDRKSRYVESLMLGLPVPQIVLAEDPTKKSRFIVLDGKQRLITMKQFVDPDHEFPSFRLKNLTFLDELNGLDFSKIRYSLHHATNAENLLVQPVHTVVVRNWRSEAVLYEIFVRLNQGSLPLSPQELRQALYPGDFLTWVNERSAESEFLHAARRITGPDFRMRDAEMLLRAIAFYERLEHYSGQLREFLNDMCRIGNDSWSERSTHYMQLADRMEVAIRRTIGVFGQRDAFLRFAEGEYIRRFNIAVFDIMCLIFGDESVTDADIEQNAEAIRAAYQDISLTNSDFQDSLKSTTKTPNAIGQRILLFGDTVSEVLGKDLNMRYRATQLLRKVSER